MIRYDGYESPAFRWISRERRKETKSGEVSCILLVSKTLDTQSPSPYTATTQKRGSYQNAFRALFCQDVFQGHHCKVSYSRGGIFEASAGYILAARFLNSPAKLALSKMLVPETATP